MKLMPRTMSNLGLAGQPPRDPGSSKKSVSVRLKFGFSYQPAINSFGLSGGMAFAVSAKGMPMVGFGTYNRIDRHQEMADAVGEAIKVGYRHFDLAEFYSNEDLIGEVIERAIAAGQVTREELFLTSKVWNHNHGAADVVACCDERLRLLRTSYLDLFLVHWPVAFKHDTYRLQRSKSDPFYAELDESISLEETWRAMESLVDAGKVRAIGVSNFGLDQMDEILSFARIRPVVHQLECHPYLSQEPMRQYCERNNITMVAFSCVGRPGVLAQGQPNILDEPAVIAVAEKVRPARRCDAASWLTSLLYSLCLFFSTSDFLRRSSCGGTCSAAWR